MNEHTYAARTSLSARGAVALVRFYQRFLTGLKPPTCRFHPTCSEYAAQAIAHRGLLRGLCLAIWRVLRCNPFSAGGYDPGPWARPAGRHSSLNGSREMSP
jgi:putative membrane protein insertion efficiency factor